MGRVEQSPAVEGETTTDSLVAFVKERAGEALRVIAEFERADCEVRYRRDDLQRDAIADRMQTLHQETTLAWNPADEEALAGVGEKQATVEIRETAVIVHLLLEVDRRYVMEFEHSAARNLTAFLAECFEHSD